MPLSSRAFAGGIGGALVATVFYMGFYLPFMSPEALRRREEVASGKVTVSKGKAAPGSMWRNLDARLAQGRGDGRPAAPPTPPPTATDRS
jgi:hypothetical protein